MKHMTAPNIIFPSLLLPYLKINHKCNMMFTMRLLIVLATLLNLSNAVQYQPQPPQSLTLSQQHSRLLAAAQRPSSTLQLAKQWKLFTYNFLPHAPMHDMKFFNPSNILATGLAIAEDRIFIATPKLFSGVSSTLNWISRTDFEQSPVLQVSLILILPLLSFISLTIKKFRSSILGLSRLVFCHYRAYRFQLQ